MRALPILLIALGLGLATPSAIGAPPTADAPRALRAGDPAPKLTAAAWCNGQPNEQFQRGKAYVVEFFATYDPASRDDFRHLTGLQERHAKSGLSIIGVATRTRREAEPAAEFVQRFAERIAYPVAIDDSGAAELAWMRAAQRYSLPCAFVVDRTGTVVWMGSVRTGLAGVVEKVMNGTFNAQEQAASDAQFAGLERDFTDARRAGEWDKAFAILDQARQSRPESAAMIELTRFEVTLTEKQDAPAAYRIASRIITAELKDEERLLRRVAGVIAEHPGVKSRNWDVALAAVEQAVKTTAGKDGWALGALAEIQFQRGEIEQAIKTQVQAMIVAEGDPQLSPKVSDAMDRYRLAQAKPATPERTVTTVPGTD